MKTTLLFSPRGCKLADFLFFYLFASLFFFTPLLFFPFFTFPFEFPKGVFFFLIGSLLFFLHSLRSFLNKNYQFLPKTFLAKPIFLYLAILTFSTIFSIQPSRSLFGWWAIYPDSLLHSLLLIALFYLAYLTFDSFSKVKQLLYYATAAGFFVALLGVISYYQQSNRFFRIYSTIGEANRLAFYLVAVLPLALVLFLEEKKLILKTTHLLNSLLIFWALLLTFTRSAWITLILLVCLTGLVLWKKRKLCLKKYLSFLKNPIALIALIIFFFILGHLYLFISQRVISTFTPPSETQSSLHLRLSEVKQNLKTIFYREKWSQHLLGTGPETLYYTALEFRPLIYNYTQERGLFTIHARNYYLYLLSTLGWLGFASFFFLVFLILKNFLISLNSSKIKNNSVYWGIFFSWLAILIQSLFYYQTVEVSLYFWLLPSVFFGSLKNTSLETKAEFRSWIGKIDDPGSWKKKIAILIILFSLFTLSFSFLNLLADYQASQATEAGLSKATKLAPWNDTYLYYLAQKQFNQALPLEDEKKLFQSLETIKKAQKLDPLEIRHWRLRYQIYYIAGVHLDKKYHQEAEETAKKLTQLDPTNPYSWDDLGLVYLDLGQLEKALENFQKAMEKQDTYIGAYLHSGEALKQMGKIKEAIQFYQKAVNLDPGWEFSQKELEKAKLLIIDN